MKIKPIHLVLLCWGMFPAKECCVWGAGSASGMGRPSAEPVHTEQKMARLPVVRTRRISIHYQLNLPPESISRVELWYARGNQQQGESWQFYDFDADRISPILFEAPSEGVYRFLIVASDHQGRRSCGGHGIGPAAGMIPNTVSAHVTMFIDFTPPQLFLKNPRGAITGYDQETLKISWMGFDSFPGSQPVSLYYGREPFDQSNWMLIAGGLAAVGDYEWRLPAELSGAIMIQAVLRDWAGNRDVRYSEPISITSKIPVKVKPLPEKGIGEKTVSPTASSPQAHQINPVKTVNALIEYPPGTYPYAMANTFSQRQDIAYPDTGSAFSARPADTVPKTSASEGQFPSEPKKGLDPQRLAGTVIGVKPNPIPSQGGNVPTTPPIKSEARLQADNYFVRGSLYRQRGEWNKAAQAFEKALAIDEGYLEARLRLGEVLYGMNRFERGRQQFELSLRTDATSETALLGLARCQMALKQYGPAKATLERLLRQDALVGQGWLMHGDAAQELGDNGSALESWKQAVQLGSPLITGTAQNRLQRFSP